MTKKERLDLLKDGYYQIVRFSRDGAPAVVAVVASLETARAICKDPNTEGARWFCGYSSRDYGNIKANYKPLKAYIKSHYDIIA